MRVGWRGRQAIPRPGEHPNFEGLEKTEKRCRTCGEVKPLTAEFWPRDANQPDGFQGWCKACKQARQKIDYAKDPMKHRERQLIAKFGMTNADYDRMLEIQGGKCAICGRTDSKSKLDPNNPAKHGSILLLHIDHDYNTGQVRGLLCGTCNRGLGSFHDDAEMLEKAAAYLRHHAAKPSVFRKVGK